MWRAAPAAVLAVALAAAVYVLRTPRSTTPGGEAA
ncbi:hypothetical protein J2S22_000905 [Rhodoplanes tepidamans]|nr:hypothetical protein [Rhodoplanes tepidamans]